MDKTNNISYNNSQKIQDQFWIIERSITLSFSAIRKYFYANNNWISDLHVKNLLI